MPLAVRTTDRRIAYPKYVPPHEVLEVGLWELIGGVREIPVNQQRRLTLPGLGIAEAGPIMYCAGDITLARKKCVAVVGSRKVSPEGATRARRLARELVEAGVVVVSGLAEGVDTNAHSAAIDAGGHTVAVIGTPLDVSYPAKNARLQEAIYSRHLLVSPFPPGGRVYKSNFPQRNKVMAAIADVTVIVEASDTSGSLHQAAECGPGRLDRWLFIAKSVLDDRRITWPREFLGKSSKARVLEQTSDILAVL